MNEGVARLDLAALLRQFEPGLIDDLDRLARLALIIEAGDAFRDRLSLRIGQGQPDLGGAGLGLTHGGQNQLLPFGLIQ